MKKKNKNAVALGKIKSVKKTKAARQNIQKRWALYRENKAKELALEKEKETTSEILPT